MTAALILTLLPAMAFAEEEAAYPVSAEWGFGFPHGVLGTSTVDLENEVYYITVTYSDDSVINYVYDEYSRTEGDESYEKKGFFAKKSGEYLIDPESEAASFYPFLENESVSFEEGFNTVTLAMNVPYIVSGEGTDDEDVSYKYLTADVDVLCDPAVPLSVEFLPADGFEPGLYLGYNFVTEYDFYGEGNAFRVTYEQYDVEESKRTEYTTTYSYAAGKDEDGNEVEGFFMKGDTTLTRFTFEGEDYDFAEAGSYDLDFTYVEDVQDLDEAVSVPFTVNVAVNKYNAYADTPIYTYTGNVKKPKFTVYDSLDNKIPASAYTVTSVKNKKMGWYQTTVTFKDKSKYVDSIEAYYGIGPKAPKLTKTTAGKKRLTVNWKKFSKAQLKKMDGMYIEVSTDKHFLNNYKVVKVSKKALKSGKKVIKGLKKGKRYYVRAYTFNKIKQDGETFRMPSADSKVLKSKKIKK